MEADFSMIKSEQESKNARSELKHMHWGDRDRRDKIKSEISQKQEKRISKPSN